MPRLENFTAEQGGLPINSGRAATAQDFGADQFKQVQNVGAQIIDFSQAVFDRAEADEVRNVVVQSQELRAKWSARMSAAELSGEPLEPLMEEFSTENEQIAQNTSFNSGLYAARKFGSESNELFVGRSMQITATREKASVIQEVQRSDQASAALLQQSPAMLPMLIQERVLMVNTYRGRVPPQVLEQLKIEGAQDLTATAASAMINDNPKMALDLLTSTEEGKDIFHALAPNQRTALIHAAEIAIKAQEADADNAYRDAQRAQKKADDDAMDAMLGDIGNAKGNEWTNKRILTQQGVSPDQKIRMGQVFNEYNRRAEANDDGEGFNNVYKGIVAGTVKRQELDEALVRGAITPKGHSQLVNVLAREDRPETQLEGYFFSKMESDINPRDFMGRFMAPNGAINSVKFKQDMWAIRDQFVKDKRDPTPLFDPGTKEFQQYTAPLLARYRAKTVTVYNADGTTTQVQSPGSVQGNAVKVRTEADFNALPPGTWFEFNGRTGMKPFPKPSASDTRVPATNPAQAEKGVAAPPSGEQRVLDEIIKQQGAMPNAPREPYTYPPGFVPTPIDPAWRR